MDSNPSASPSFEQTLEELQKRVRKLETGELSLEESLKCFEEGVRLTRACQDYLQKAERRIEVLMQSQGDDVKLESFAGPESET